MPDQKPSTEELNRPEEFGINVREWWAERVGWFVIAVILIGALLGAFGPGLLGQREAASEDGELKVQYYGVQRYSAPAELRVNFEPRHRDAHLVQLAFSQRLADKIEVKTITPLPIATSLEDRRVVYSFRIADLREQGHIVYRYQHESYGPLTGTITLLPSSEIRLSQFICP